jgi:hypothetical protein
VLVKLNPSIIVLEDVSDKILHVKGIGNLKCRITFISKGSYKAIIKISEEYKITINSKDILRVELDNDIFTIQVLETTGKLNIVINNIQDYLSDKFLIN